MINLYIRKNLLFSSLLCASLSANAQVSMTLDAQKRAAMISDYQYGLFFEEINHAGDGGLYAELIRNRSFEDNLTSPEYWSAVKGSSQNVSLSLNKSDLLNKAQNTSLRMTVSGAGETRKAGVCNTGFWGMKFSTGSTYHLTLWVKGAENLNGKIYGQLQKTDGSAAS